MKYKRVHVRVPISGEATLSNNHGITLKAQTINISKGGLSISSSVDHLEQTEYHITITTTDDESISLTAHLIRQNNESIGFKTLEIDQDSMAIINEMVAEFQSTTDFIEQLDRHNLFEQSFIDEDGNELEVTFDIDDV